MFFHVLLTTECNLQCRYCFGENMEDFEEDFSGIKVDYSLPKKVSYDWRTLTDFCGKDSDCVLTFYGGEPLMCTAEIRQVMDSVRAKWFMIQTNGLLLDRLESEYVNRFHTILVSIDGDKALTDYYRGKGTFRRVVENLKLIRKNGYNGELIARMTVMEQTDIFRQVTWLLNNRDFSFSSVHWQLNAGFWGNDYARRDFRRWSEDNYIPSVARLAEFWVDQMEKNHAVHKLYPFLGIANSLLNGESDSLLRCGGGWINYTIQTDGNIVPCPSMGGMKDYYLGNIRDADPLKLKKLFVSKPCIDCETLQMCGGRCLYANITRRWNENAYAEVCNTVKSLVNAVEKQLPRINRLISDGAIGLHAFNYVKYNGCEIIP